MYLLERIGSSGKVWLVCRPALDPEQETEPRFQLPGMTEDDEFICFERVDFGTLQPGDEFQVSIAGSLMVITCPPGVGPGSVSQCTGWGRF